MQALPLQSSHVAVTSSKSVEPTEESIALTVVLVRGLQGSGVSKGTSTIKVPLALEGLQMSADVCRCLQTSADV